jgi:REP element-mobilizing transposase RayT
MSTFVQTLYQIVFSTKNRENTLNEESRERLYEYIFGIIKNNKSYCYKIGGTDDHLHIIIQIHTSIAPADLVKDIKLATNKYIKENGLFSRFQGWQEGYGLFTYQINAKENLIEYVNNQKEHHRKLSFKEELILLLKEHKIEYNEEYIK